MKGYLTAIKVIFNLIALLTADSTDTRTKELSALGTA